MSCLSTAQIPLEKLHDFQLKVIGDNKCAEQLIIINGIEIGTGASEENKGKGIGTIELILEPSEKPKLSIHYHKRLILEEVANALGLQKVFD